MRQDATTVTVECAGVEFTVKGSVVKQTGWRAVYGEERGNYHPRWQEGDTLTPKGSSITEGKTKTRRCIPKPPCSRQWKRRARKLRTTHLRQAMKDCGIGTPATRASIIETLFKRGYMERCKKSLVPTEKGLALNSVVKTMRIADVAMTGEWEKELARIERGELSDEPSVKEIEAYTREITSELDLVRQASSAAVTPGCACPKCGTGRMRFYGKVVRRVNTEWRTARVPAEAGRTLSDDEIKDLLTEGHTKLLKGFKSKQGKSFDAVVAFDGEYNTTFVFPEAKRTRNFRTEEIVLTLPLVQRVMNCSSIPDYTHTLI
ncbi:DNA topoisomerase [Bacteroides caccae]|uniref:DNA topoisomerase n=1 Tax=Bacteroides caccae TaxID=47678 RepID=UPI002166489B|nr:DNA topoisomerase [Bacteroides caccae]MCS3193858.1 DNA topoisomerase [Bacteroides caccae]